MGKKRAAAVSVPFPAPASEPESDHFSDYGFDPQLLHFPSQVHLISSSSSQHYTTALHDCNLHRPLPKGTKIHACCAACWTLVTFLHLVDVRCGSSVPLSLRRSDRGAGASATSSLRS